MPSQHKLKCASTHISQIENARAHADESDAVELYGFLSKRYNGVAVKYRTKECTRVPLHGYVIVV